MNKYVTITPRIMTVEEASEICHQHGITGRAKEFILDEFMYFNDPDGDLGNYVGKEGRISYGYSWEGIMDRLGEAMGLDMDMNWDQIRKVYDLFFQE